MKEPSIQYKSEYTKNTFAFSYQELREEYKRHVEMSNKEFLENLPSALHVSIFISYIKQRPSYIALCDEGIIHELTHLLQHGENGGIKTLKEIRKQFKKELKLNY